MYLTEEKTAQYTLLWHPDESAFVDGDDYIFLRIYWRNVIWLILFYYYTDINI